MLHWFHALEVISLLCFVVAFLCRRSRRRLRPGKYAPVPSSSSRVAQDITRETLPLPARVEAPGAARRQEIRLYLLHQIERYFPGQLPAARRWLEPPEALAEPAAAPAASAWPELLLGPQGEPRFAGHGEEELCALVAVGDAGGDPVELLRRVQEILEACRDPSRHQALEGLTIRCVLEKPPHHSVWFAEAPGAPVPFVVSQTVIQTTLPLDAVLWSIYSPTERLKWDQSPFVAHEILPFGGGVQDTARRDFLYSRVTIAPGISDRDLVQERFLIRLPDQSGYAILMSSCSAEMAIRLGRPETPEAVRTRDLLSAYVLQSCDAGIRLMTLSQKDVGSHVPSFFQHMARSVGKRKPLEMAQQLERHCRQAHCPDARG